MTTALAKVGGGWSIAPANLTELFRFAELMADSELVPKDYRNKPGNVMVAIQMGGELGLSPMQAVQSIAVINGRPSLWGDGLLALCQGHPSFVDMVETDDGATATCVVTRSGRALVTQTFSVQDAKLAGLHDKAIWKQYPARMRKMRARGFALRDAFADVLKGVSSAEEVSDIPREVRATVVETKQETPPEAPPEPLAGPVDTRLRGIGKGPLAGKVLEECTFEELGHYIAAIERLPAGKRAPFEQHLKAAGEVFDEMALREMDRAKAMQQPPAAAEPDEIVEGLEREVDKMRNGDTNEGWGLTP